MNKNLSNRNKPKVIAIVGATASGKTAYSIELAQKINGEIVSADSRLVYKGFDIGTAKPAKQERSGVPHHLIDIVEPEFEYSAGLYKKQAAEIINQILSRGAVPVITGGTGLYIDILLKNYDLPQIEPDRNLRDKLREMNTKELFELLKELDEQAAKGIDSNDGKKIIRAIEIIKTTGKPLSESRGMNETDYDVEWIGRNFERKTLYKRIDLRVDQMFEAGLIKETKNLLAKHGRIPNLVNTIGYREVIGFLDGEYSKEEASILLKKNTRNYAKRQLTWFRRNEEIHWNVYPEKLKK